jgi:hypothetical protein
MQMRMRAALTALCEQMPPAGNSQAQVGSVVPFLLVGPDGECGLVAGAERMPLVQVPSSAQPSPAMQLLRRRALRTALWMRRSAAAAVRFHSCGRRYDMVPMVSRIAVALPRRRQTRPQILHTGCPTPPPPVGRRAGAAA